jgi:LmbE family N-acetylglucosaminyl deacetylase
MCRIADEKTESKKRETRTYYLVLTAAGGKSGGIEIKEVYTKNEYEKFKHLIKDGEPDKLPKREGEDKTAIDRYVEHEEVIDKWIRDRMEEDPDNYIEIEPRCIGDFLFKLYNTANKVRGIGEALDGNLLDTLYKIFENRKLVFIKVEDGEELPVIYENDQEIEVGAHTSRSAMYIFVKKRGSAFKNLRSFADMLVKNEEDTYKTVPADTQIIPKLLHEVGVVCGLEYTVTNGRIINDFDRLYNSAKHTAVENVTEIPLAEELASKISPENLKNLVNLDYLRGTAERRYERDYAIEFGNPKKARIEREIATIWATLGKKKIDFFSEPAQRVFAKILDIAGIKDKSEIPTDFHVATCYRLALAKLYHQRDYKMVIEFFESLYDMPEGRTILRQPRYEPLLRNLLELYYIARMLEPGSAEEARTEGKNFFLYCIEEIFEGKPIPDHLKAIINPDHETIEIVYFKEQIEKKALHFAKMHESMGNNDAALSILDNIIIYLENEPISTFVIRQQSIERDIGMAKITKIMLEVVRDFKDIDHSVRTYPDTIAEIVLRINKVWKIAGSDEGIKENPFSVLANLAFKAIDILAAQLAVRDMFLQGKDINKKICMAMLYGGDLNHKGVINFFEEILLKLRDQGREVLQDKEFLQLYFMARMLNVPEGELFSLRTCRMALFGEDSDDNVLGESDRAVKDFKEAVLTNAIGFIEDLCGKKDYDKALRLCHIVILCISYLDLDEKTATALLEELRALKNIIEAKKERDQGESGAAGQPGDEPENPVAGIDTSSVELMLLHLARHPLVNALISMILEYDESVDKKTKKDKFIRHEGKRKKIYWFGYDKEENENFLDIFNKLVQIRAKKHKGDTPTSDDEIELVQKLVERAGLQNIVYEVNSQFVRELKTRFSFQVEHFSVRKGTIYAMRKYRKKYSSQIKKHANLERSIHITVIDEVFKEDADKYLSWRKKKIGRIPIDIKIALADETVSIKGTMTYNEFAQAAHEIAQKQYPIGKQTFTFADRGKICTQFMLEDLDVAVGAAIAPEDNTEFFKDNKGCLLAHDEKTPENVNSKELFANERMLVLEKEEGDADAFYGNSLRVLEENGNEILRVLVNNQQAFSKIKEFDPDIVVAPDGDRATDKLLQRWADYKDGANVSFYRSLETPSDINLSVGFDRWEMFEVALEAVLCHRTQFDRTDFVAVCKHSCDYAAALAERLGLQPEPMPYANNFAVSRIDKKGNVIEADNSKKYQVVTVGEKIKPGFTPIRLSKDCPLILIAPHPDDPDLAASGLIRKVLKMGGTVYYLVFSTGETGVVSTDAQLADPNFDPRIVRREELQNAANILETGTNGKIVIHHFDLEAVSQPSAIGEVPIGDAGFQEGLGAVKDEFEKIFNKHRQAYLREGRIPIVNPHPKDRHPHHRITNNMTRIAFRKLARNNEIETLLMSYYAIWAGNDNMYLHSDTNMSVDDCSDEALSEKAEIAAHYKRALSRVTPELTGGFGKKVAWYHEMGGEFAEGSRRAYIPSRKAVLKEMKSTAKEVGVDVAQPVSDYTLVVDTNLYKDNELKDDMAGYSIPGIGHVGTIERFNIETADTSNVNNILKHVNVKNAKNTIVQISEELNNDDLIRLKTERPGIRIMRINTKDFRADFKKDMRRKARFNLYTRMLLARRITWEDVAEKNNIYRLFSFYINVHYGDGYEDIAKEYIEALLTDDFSYIIKKNLAYRPAKRWRIKEYHLIAATLLYA